jgi:hypothetical protein
MNEKRTIGFTLCGAIVIIGTFVLGYIAGKHYGAKPVSADIPIARQIENQQQRIGDGVDAITNDVRELGARVTTSLELLDSATNNVDDIKQRIDHSLDLVERNTSELEYLDIILRQLAEREGYAVRSAGKN